MRGMWISKNAMNFCAIKLHYSANPARDPQSPDPVLREAAHAWLQEAKAAQPDPHAWDREMEVSFTQAHGVRVYPEFTEAIHAPMALAPNPRKVLYRAWDFGFHAPVCLVGSVDRKDRLLIVREIVGHQMPIRDFAQMVLDKCAAWYPLWGPGWLDFCDPAGQQVKSLENERSERRDVDVLRGLGIYPEWKHGWSRRDGRSLVHQLLTVRADSTPGMLVDPHQCPLLMQSFLGRYVYPESKQGSRVREEPDENDHPWSDLMAALRYMVTGLFPGLGLARFRHTGPAEPAKAPAYHGYGVPVRHG